MIEQPEAEFVAIEEALATACKVNGIYADVIGRARAFLMAVGNLSPDEATYLLLGPDVDELQKAVDTLSAIQAAFPHMFTVL